MDMQAHAPVNTLRALERFGQSAWLDFIERKFPADGSLHKMIAEDGLKGMTSNPSIFARRSRPRLSLPGLTEPLR